MKKQENFLVIDLFRIFNRLVKNNQGKGLYCGEFYKFHIDLSEFPKPPNPIESNGFIKRKASAFGKNFKINQIEAIKDLYEKLRRDGEFGIEYDPYAKRPNGCFKAYEVIEQKKGVCLEQTNLFLAFCNQANINLNETRSIGFSIYNHESGIAIWHACGAFILDDLPQKLRHIRFDLDSSFRKFVLNLIQLPDNKNLGLLLIDLTNNIFASQHTELKPMSNSDLVSSYLSNASSFLEKDGNSDLSFRYIRESMRMGNQIGRSNYALSCFERNLFDEGLKLLSDVDEILCPYSLAAKGYVLNLKKKEVEAALSALQSLQRHKNHSAYSVLANSLTDKISASAAFRRAYETALLFDPTRKNIHRFAELFGKWMDVIEIDPSKVNYAIELHLSSNTVFQIKGGWKIDYFGEIKNTYIEPQNSFRIIRAYTKTSQISKVAEWLEVLDRNSLEKFTPLAHFLILMGHYKLTPDLLLSNIFALYQLVGIDKLKFAVETLGIYDLKIETDEMTFSIDGINFFAKNFVANQFDMNLSEVFSFASKHARFVEIGRLFKLAYEASDPNKALDFINQAIDIDPDIELFEKRAAIYRKLGNEEKAIEDETKLFEIDPKLSERYELLEAGILQDSTLAIKQVYKF